MARHIKFTHYKSGLFDSRKEHDACGVGFVANVRGERSSLVSWWPSFTRAIFAYFFEEFFAYVLIRLTKCRLIYRRVTGLLLSYEGMVMLGTPFRRAFYAVKSFLLQKRRRNFLHHVGCTLSMH